MTDVAVAFFTIDQSRLDLVPGVLCLSASVPTWFHGA